MENNKMWAGRFALNTSTQADSFNTSLPFDCRMYREDITGSIVHCTMLGKVGILEEKDSKLISKTLAEILDDIEAGTLSFDSGEDIHMWVEAELTKRIGEVGKKLHTARSRNDQVALDFRMHLRSCIDEIGGKLGELIETLLTISENNLETYMPGYTHLQHAQPITLAHHFMAYVGMFLRDVDRLFDCFKRTNVLPLGSCALATTTHPIDREMVAQMLGFDSVCDNSLDGVSDRDFCMEYLSVLSIVMIHLSRISEEIILWATSEFSFIELSDAYSTGSSIMPQKKNPDMLELIRGKTGRVVGDLTGMLTMMKGLPLAYNKDMQEDKEFAFDATDTVKACLSILIPVLETAEFRKSVMRDGSTKGFAAATDIADYLVKVGMSFREAHGVVGALVQDCIRKNKTIEELSAHEFASFHPLLQADVVDAVKLEHIVANRNRTGGPAPSSVKNSIERARKTLAEHITPKVSK